MSPKVTPLPTSRPAPRPGVAPAMPLEEIRALVRADLAAVDTMIRARLKSTVPLVDQGHGALQPGPNHGVYPRKIGANQHPDLFQGHGGGIDGTGARPAGGQSSDFGAHSGR